MEALLAQIRSEITSREEQVTLLRSQISSLREAMKIIASSGTAPQQMPIALGASSPAATTHPAMAVDVLRDSGQAMRVSEIAEKIKIKFGREVVRTSLSTILYKYAQKDHLFFKEPNNIYGLLEWRNNNGHGTGSATQERAH